MIHSRHCSRHVNHFTDTHIPTGMTRPDDSTGWSLLTGTACETRGYTALYLAGGASTASGMVRKKQDSYISTVSCKLQHP